MVKDFWADSKIPIIEKPLEKNNNFLPIIDLKKNNNFIPNRYIDDVTCAYCFVQYGKEQEECGCNVAYARASSMKNVYYL